jgi:hypothetical protein
LISACDLVRMTTNQELVEQIERLVREHIEATRTAATAAVARAFAATEHARASDDTPVRKARPSQSGAAPRRAAEELAALAEQFYAVLCRNPGETMMTLAPQVGASARALHRAVTRLKRGGRVRSVGERQRTRYFPMTCVPVAA